MSEGIATAAPSTASAGTASTGTSDLGTGVISSPSATESAAPIGNGKEAPTPAQVQDAVDKFELVMRGQKQEFNLKDKAHLEKIKMMAQKGDSADQKFQEAAYMRKQAEDFIKLLKTNPEAVLGNPAVGLDVQKWAEEFLWNRMEEAKKSPEQKEAEANKRKLSEYQERERMEAEKQKETAFEQAKEQYKGKLTEDIISTLSQTNLPKSARTVARMAHYILQAKQSGWNDVTPKDVVDMVREDYVQEHNELLGALPQEELLKILNAEVRKKIREAELWALKHPGQPVPAALQPKLNEENHKPPKKGMNKAEWRAYIDERTRGLE
jgi:hypothetical protein